MFVFVFQLVRISLDAAEGMHSIVHPLPLPLLLSIYHRILAPLLMEQSN